MICLGPLLVVLAGCGAVRPAQVMNASLAAWEASDPNALGVTLVRTEDGGLRYEYAAAFDAEPQGAIAFWGHHYRMLDVPVVRAEINGRAYPAVFDTGNGLEATVIEDIHVRENDLPAVFFNDEKTTGMALVRDFRVGSLRAEDYPCVFLKNHTGIRVFGIPVGRSRHVVLPLSLMRGFRYFAFDQVRGEVRYSAAEAFEPGDPDGWVSMPFEVRDNQILLTAAIEGVEAVLLLDTGAGLDLELDEKVYYQVEGRRPDLRERWRQTRTLYNPYVGGRMEVKRLRAERLRLGEWVLPEAEVYYGRLFGDKPYQGIVGFELFRGTVMVVDFERGRLWVQKTEGSRFGS